MDHSPGPGESIADSFLFVGVVFPFGITNVIDRAVGCAPEVSSIASCGVFAHALNSIATPIAFYMAILFFVSIPCFAIALAVSLIAKLRRQKAIGVSRWDFLYVIPVAAALTFYLFFTYS